MHPCTHVKEKFPSALRKSVGALPLMEHVCMVRAGQCFIPAALHAESCWTGEELCSSGHSYICRYPSWSELAGLEIQPAGTWNVRSGFQPCFLTRRACSPMGFGSSGDTGSASVRMWTLKKKQPSHLTFGLLIVCGCSFTISFLHRQQSLILDLLTCKSHISGSETVCCF